MRQMMALIKKISFPKTVSTLGLSVLLTTPALAGGTEALSRFNETVRTFQADFSQAVYDESGQQQSTASGTLQVQRPGKFRWDYQAPYQQLIVANGKRIWIYDADLEQVNIKPYQQAMANAPGALFDGTRPLEEEFKLRDLGRSDGIEWVELLPKSDQAEFSAIYVGLDDKGPALMDLRDKLGQSTQIQFQKLDNNPTLQASLFEFVPPAGVDVVEQQ